MIPNVVFSVQNRSPGSLAFLLALLVKSDPHNYLAAASHCPFAYWKYEKFQVRNNKAYILELTFDDDDHVLTTKLPSRSDFGSGCILLHSGKIHQLLLLQLSQLAYVLIMNDGPSHDVLLEDSIDIVPKNLLQLLSG